MRRDTERKGFACVEDEMLAVDQHAQAIARNSPHEQPVLLLVERRIDGLGSCEQVAERNFDPFIRLATAEIKDKLAGSSPAHFDVEAIVAMRRVLCEFQAAIDDARSAGSIGFKSEHMQQRYFAAIQRDRSSPGLRRSATERDSQLQRDFRFDRCWLLANNETQSRAEDEQEADWHGA